MTEKFFNSRYPIMEALMNGGSDLPLALAVAEAGAFPSYWYRTNQELHSDIKEFVHCFGHTNIVVGGITTNQLTDLEFLKLINELKVSHIELLATDYQTGNFLDMRQLLTDSKLSVSMRFLKKTSKMLTRIYQPTTCSITNSYFDAYCIKGQESAGKTSTFMVSDLFDSQQIIGGNCLIPYGGIGTPDQVKNYVDRGAVAVAVGTLFAASIESPLSDQAKQQLIQSTSDNLTRLADTNQNSLILDKDFKNAIPTAENNWNRQNYLDQGLHGNGNEGLLYIGKGVDHVNEIRPVKDIVKYLVSKLGA
jgi:NAD(P)H-dependent flavin oxidoreductase YrpB (nitropropane dioxygenase family)